LTASLRLLVMAVAVTAVTLFLAAAAIWPINAALESDGQELPGLLFWIGITLIASSFPVSSPRGSLVSVSIAPILAAAVLGGPTAAAIVAGIGSTELREVRLRIPWYGTLYNHSVVVIAAIVAGALYAALVGFGTSPTTLPTFGAVLVAGGAYFAVNESLTAAAIAVREHRSPVAVLTSDLRAFGLALLGLAPLSWLMALAYTMIGPWAAVLFALPLYTTRAAYQSVVEIRKMFTQTVRALASAIDARDPYTKRHSERVATIAVDIGQALGLSEAQLEQLEWGGLLHDIGKIGVPDAVLLKPERLNKEERMVMNDHPAKGHAILEGVERLRPELDVILHHHQWYNGSGYPKVNEAGLPDADGHALFGEGIPFLARVLHVADSFEAMTSSRPYRPRPLNHAQALAELRKYEGIQFDPRVVDAFMKTTWAQGGDTEPVEVPAPAPIPMLGQVAALRSKGSVSASVTVDLS
jgi:HD domain